MEEQKFVYVVNERDHSTILVYFKNEHFDETLLKGKFLYTEDELKAHIAKYIDLWCLAASLEPEVEKEVQRIHNLYNV